MTLEGNNRGVKRSYHSPLREEQLGVTRTSILEAAHELFLAHGYAATTIKKVAMQASVSEKTVYNTFGDKPSLLFAVGKRVVEGELAGGGRDLVSELEQEPDPRRRIEILAGWSRMTLEQGMLSFESMLLDAAATDKRVAEVAADAMQRKRAEIANLFSLVFPEGVRSEEFDLDEALDLAFAIDSTATIRILIEECGWSYDEYERLLVVLLRRLFTNLPD